MNLLVRNDRRARGRTRRVVNGRAVVGEIEQLRDGAGFHIYDLRTEPHAALLVTGGPFPTEDAALDALAAHLEAS